jgi:hypothetical protein
VVADKLIPVVSATSADEQALAQMLAKVAAAELENAKLREAKAASVLPSTDPEMQALRARLGEVQQRNAALRETNRLSPDFAVHHSIARNPPQMHNTIAATSLLSPFPRTAGPFDSTTAGADVFGFDNRDEGDFEDDNSHPQDPKPAPVASIALLQEQAAHDIRLLREFWLCDTPPSYQNILRAAESELGLQVLTAIGSVHAGKFGKSLRWGGKGMHLRSVELYGLPNSLKPSKDGLSRDSNGDQILFPR